MRKLVGLCIGMEEILGRWNDISDNVELGKQMQAEKEAKFTGAEFHGNH